MKGPLLIIVIFCILSPLFVSSIDAAVDFLSVNQSIADGETIVSANGSYQLGFFSPSNDNSLEKRYLGIWYTFSNETVVWVANREIALNDTSGVLQVTSQGILTIRNSKNLTIWSSNSTNTSRQARNPVAQLLETGNLVVREADDTNEENYLWQSFDYLYDTLLSGAKLGKNFVTGVDNYLVSWKSPDDPSIGDATYKLYTDGYPQVVVAVGGKKVFRSGPWNGFSFGGLSNLRPNSLFSYQCYFSTEEVFCEYDLYDKSVFTRMVINSQGFVQRLNWSSSTRTWNTSLILQMDTCDSYALCGAFGSCNINSSPKCSCLEGFTPKFPLDWGSGNWSGGCVRQKELVCGSGETFQQIDGVKLPDARTSWAIKGLNLTECETGCLKNCSCTAYSTLDISYGTGCLFWREDLLDIREYDGNGQTFFLRVSSSGQKDTSNRKKIGIVISSVLFALLIMLVVVMYICKRKSRKHGIMINHNTNFDNEEGKEDMESGVFDLTTIVNSTEGFSSNNILGEGGFGSVYKGTLADGQEIAVKRLSKSSGQGMSEFKNEVILIAKLQHRNLVKLLGCCVHGDEKMLVYEFMPNKSLDYFIFDQSRRKSLDWNKRMVIIEGTARGLLYLHQDSRLRVIHRDLKASNILLDASMNPKISDFGMARMFTGDQHAAKTKMVVGTYGYIAPEYAVDGLFSTKSDVFSFGVLVLEIVSGTRNRGFSHTDHSHNLLGHAWKLWMEDRALELVDNTLDDVFRKSEALRCIHVGLLCVQQRPEDRPNMSSVVLMLSSENILPEPKQPGFFTERNMPESESSSTNHKSSSMNGMTITLLDAR